jgi:gamma-glutamylcyclotransferase (GGCT)/AIG2-like uncharacterized protein YtfP
LTYFFYGTLMDPEVLRTVIGRRIPPSNRRAALIGGYRRVYRAGACYPILIADTESGVKGILVTGLTAADAVRLAAFEGHEYDLAEVPVTLARGEMTRARVFFPTSCVPGTSREWTLREWRRRHRAGTRARRELRAHAARVGYEREEMKAG